MKQAGSGIAARFVCLRWGLSGWLCALAAVVALAGAAGLGMLRSHAQTASPPPALNPPGSVSAQASTAAQQNQRQGEAADDASRREIASECADLLKMATALKAEVDKSNKDTLSVAVVRKAGEIEQFARQLRGGAGKN